MNGQTRIRLGSLLGGVLCGLLALPASAHDTVYYYLTDSLHSAVVITDQNRNVVERTDYAAYGQVTRSLRDGPGYTGHEEDPGTGLVYMQQRYYDPKSRRFISTDPVQPTTNGGNLNRYWYAKDNPYRYTDPDGRCPKDISNCVETVPPSFFRDTKVGRFLASTVGNTVALFTTDNVNPLNNQYVGPSDLKEAKLGILTLAIPVAKPETAVLNIAEEALPVIKVGSAGGETAGKVFSQAVKDAARAENPGAVCVYCQMEGTGTQVDHAIPRARGGNATLDNAQLACPHCNLSKGARDFPVNPPPGYRGEWPPPYWNQ